MKKDDVIAKTTIVPKGTIIAHNFSTQTKAEEWIKANCPELGEVCVDDLNPGAIGVRTSKDHEEVIEGTVNWMVDKDVAITLKNGGSIVVNLDEEPEWKVIQEAPPSFQSSVAHMSDEQLRQSIDALRAQRIVQPKARRIREDKDEFDKSDPIAQALSQMPPEKKLELMKKLGMIE
jgi:hypothetical protein